MKPKAIKVLGSQRILRIEWESSQVTDCNFAVLRKNCPCAECRAVRGKESVPLIDESSGELQLRSSTEMSIKDVKLVGNYALRLEWSDGHQHGIYTWDYIRQLCTQVE